MLPSSPSSFLEMIIRIFCLILLLHTQCTVFVATAFNADGDKTASMAKAVITKGQHHEQQQQGLLRRQLDHEMDSNGVPIQHEGKCLISMETERCPLVMNKLIADPLSMVVVDDDGSNTDELMITDDNGTPVCDCYNYCGNSKFANCCEFGGACSISCDNAGPIIAGCTWDDKDKEITTPDDDPEPSSSMLTSPNDIDVCPMTRNRQEYCPTLISNVLEGIEQGQDLGDGDNGDGCDCLNFCGDRLVGCCAFNTECSMSCQSLSPGEVLVAGCRMDPDYDYPPSRLPPSANHDNSDPAATTPEVDTGMTTPSEPGMCPIAQHRELCPSILARTDMSIIPQDCECINFCGTTFQGCCSQNPMIYCSIQCDVLEMGEKLVAGCKFDDYPEGMTIDPPIVDPPAQHPDVGPPPKCLIKQNTELCPTLLADNMDDIPEDCDCVNFCGNAFQGCCSSDTTQLCSIGCQGLQMGEKLVAGCTISEYLSVGDDTPTPSDPPTAEPTSRQTGGDGDSEEPTEAVDEDIPIISDSPSSMPSTTPESTLSQPTTTQQSLESDASLSSSTMPSFTAYRSSVWIVASTIHAAVQLFALR